MKRIFITVGVICLLAASAIAQAQTGSTAQQSKDKMAQAKAGGTPQTGALAPADRTFVRQAAAAGMAEVEMGRLATSKASNADVKQFGQRMVDDHSKANDELKAWAAKKNVTLPAELEAAHKATHDRLAKLSGDAFDRAYMKQMVADHNKAVQDFTRASKTAKDADLKAWAEKTLPTLQEHQKMARDISAKLTGTSSKR